MKYIHTFWSKPLYKNKFNKFNACLDVILSDYAYSANCIHKLNRKIVLFTDPVGAELLSFIDYDDVVILNDIDNFSEHFAAQLKFVALEQCDLGDVIIDGDLFIRKINALEIIEGVDVDCVYSFFEPSEYTLRGDMRDYYKKLITTMNKYEYNQPYHLPINWKDLQWMNTSLMKINNKELKDEYIRQYKYHKSMLEHEEYGNEWPDIIIEQYFLTLLCNDNFTTKAVIENFWFDEKSNDYALDIGFTHLGSSKIACQPWVCSMLKEENAYLYYLYKAQFEKYKNINESDDDKNETQN